MTNGRWVLGTVLVAALVGCGPATGRLQLTLTDAPADLTQADTIMVTIDEVQVHVAAGGEADAEADAGEEVADADAGADAEADGGEPAEAPAGKSGWKTVCAEPAAFDLLTLTDGRTTPMCPEAVIDAGKITQIRLVVSAGEITWKDGREPTALTVPSSEVKIVNVAKTLPANGALEILLDFDAAESIVESGQGMHLKPTIKVKN